MSRSEWFYSYNYEKKSCRIAARQRPFFKICLTSNIREARSYYLCIVWACIKVRYNSVFSSKKLMNLELIFSVDLQLL